MDERCDILNPNSQLIFEEKCREITYGFDRGMDARAIVGLSTGSTRTAQEG